MLRHGFEEGASSDAVLGHDRWPRGTLPRPVLNQHFLFKHQGGEATRLVVRGGRVDLTLSNRTRHPTKVRHCVQAYL